jgi:AraC family transcriptional regulator, regulatory protein of adaptative response / methylated-DNA-[protein]-cysteine methyltransferase
MNDDGKPFAGEPISYAFTPTVLGLAVAARSDKGVVAILIGDKQDVLLEDLRSALAGAELKEDAEGMMPILDEVACMFASPGRGGRVTLDLRGTKLEMAVWNALRKVPAGETTTYGQLAKTLDVPATAQDVGAACAANRVAIAVPCHRVVKADGSISGYRWGVHRKRKLINMEGVA